MTGNVWIVADIWRGTVSDATHELLALGRRLADSLGVRLEAVLLGQGMRGLAASLGPADAVLYVDHPTLADASGMQASRAVASLASTRGPAVILLPTTNVSWDLLGLLPGRLGAPLVSFCREVEVVDGALRVRSLLYGGKMTVTVAAGAGPVVLAVMPGTAPAEGVGAAEPTIEDVTVDLAADPGVRLIGYDEPEPGDVDIAAQETLIAVGRGISSEANIEVAEDLADVLGGAV
ncbi:MAG: hypothetical protein MUF10_20180, partial [Thermoanaerobaculaceae bacterium]|nr:hypothetical protein [Thermoanaerobaculaceae bacterium]